MIGLLDSPTSLRIVACGWVFVFLFAMNEALNGALKLIISGILGLCILLAILAGFIFLGWSGLWSAGAILLGGMLVAPFGFGAGRSLLRRSRGD